MKEILYLPTEIQLLALELPSDIINSINVSQYELLNSNKSEILSSLQQEFSQINLDNTDERTRKIIVLIMKLCLYLTEKGEELSELVEEYRNGHIDNFFRLEAERITTNNLPNMEKIINGHIEPSDYKAEQQLDVLFESMISGEGDYSEIIDKLIDLFQEYPTYFLSRLPTSLIIFIAFKWIIMPEKKGIEQIYIPLLHYAKEHNMTLFEMRLCHIIGSGKIYQYQFESALDYLDRSIELSQREENQFFISSLNNKGIVYYNTGEWEKAIEIYHKLLEENPENRPALNNLADTYYRNGEFENAYDYAQRWLESSDIESFQRINPLLIIQEILIELQKDEEEEELFSQLERIVNRNPSTHNKLLFELVKVRHHRFLGNLGIAKKLAEETLQAAMEKQMAFVIVSAHIELINIQLDLAELKNSEKALQRVYDLVDGFIQFADELGIAIASIEGLHLRSEINFEQDNPKKAKKDLYNAVKLAKEFGYSDLFEELKDELEALETVDRKEEKKSFFDNIKDGLKRLLAIPYNKKYNKKDYVIHGILVMSSSGMPLYSEYLSDKLQSDSTLISGLIAAISSFFKEVTQGQGILKSIEHEDLSLILEQYENFYIIGIYSEDTYDARRKFSYLSSQISSYLEEKQIVDHPGEIDKVVNTDLQQIVSKVYKNSNTTDD